MKLSTPKRVGIIVFGVVIGLAGITAWGLEQDAGGGWNAGSIEGEPGGAYTVYEVDENDQGGTEEPVRIVVFSGTEEDARAYFDSRSQKKSFVVPGLMIAAGAALIIVAVVPSRNRDEETTAQLEV
jgi:hypothetical protein